MFGRPEIPNETIVAALRDSYGLTASIELLPLGRDSSAWVYRAETDAGDPYFLKVRRGPFNEAGVAIPRYLRDHGIDQVIAAIPTVSGRLWQPLGRCFLVAYPFVDGESGWDRRLTDGQWVDYGRFLGSLHHIRLPADLQRLARVGTYRPDHLDTLRGMLARGPEDWDGDAAQARVAACWRSRRDEIAQILERAETLGARLASRSRDLVVCHADIHPGNVLIGREEDRVRVADWDGLVLAPRERDLMFIVDGLVPKVEPREQALFFSGYGDIDIDWPALAYYRHAWAVNDIAEFADQVSARAGGNEEARARAAETFLSLFTPGDEVDSANESYARLQAERLLG